MISSIRLMGLGLLALALVASPIAVTGSGDAHPIGSHKEWIQTHRAAPETPVKLVFAIKQKNTQLLKEILDVVSNPNSPRYGQHLSFDEVHELTGQPELADHVMKFIGAHSNPIEMEATEGGDFVKVTVRAKEAEQLLKTTYHSFSARNDLSRRIVRAREYTIPTEIEHHVDFVGNVNWFPSTHRRMRIMHPADAAGNTVPSTLFTSYNIDSPTVTNSSSTTLVWEDNDSDYVESDLTSFYTTYSIPQQPTPYWWSPSGQVNNPSECPVDFTGAYCAEPTLDIEYITAVAQGSPLTFWSADPNDAQPFLDFLISMDGNATAPLVSSISWGGDESGIPANVTSRFETEMAKLGVRGLTVTVSSGDDGAYDSNLRTSTASCSTGFTPSYPATSAYVTAVGATQGLETGTAEIACTSATNGLITSGGGFSTVFPVPDYQASIVAAYVAANTSGLVPPSTTFTATNRAYPDVALAGHNYAITLNGVTEAVSGTSCSSPVFAGLVALINSARFAAGKSSVGFINPTLYSLYASQPDIFHDITSGENNCAADTGSLNCCPYGYSAVKGWDPVSGLGSVDFAKLKAAFLALP